MNIEITSKNIQNTYFFTNIFSQFINLLFTLSKKAKCIYR
ncbi:hypothetical protein PUN28_007286 [Cardiocondyla obscurior]|uniref:Uncharacterized protein n=1 Tax=Cardiocondyla obscurior TaxID=286306 RepID=A0AAW2G7F5_9HYME